MKELKRELGASSKFVCTDCTLRPVCQCDAALYEYTASVRDIMHDCVYCTSLTGFRCTGSEEARLVGGPKQGDTDSPGQAE